MKTLELLGYFKVRVAGGSSLDVNDVSMGDVW